MLYVDAEGGMSLAFPKSPPPRIFIRWLVSVLPHAISIGQNAQE